MKTQISEQKAIFPKKKTLWPTFFVVSNMTDVREQFVETKQSCDI